MLAGMSGASKGSGMKKTGGDGRWVLIMVSMSFGRGQQPDSGEEGDEVEVIMGPMGGKGSMGGICGASSLRGAESSRTAQGISAPQRRDSDDANAGDR